MRDKITDVKTAIDLIKSGDTVLVAGFGTPGCPVTLLTEFSSRNDLRDIKIVSEGFFGGHHPWNTGLTETLKKPGMVTEAIVSFFSNPAAQKLVDSGDMKLTLVPQGIMAERLRAAGAGLGAFLSPVGVGTIVEEGKETKIINGKKYIVELPLPGNVALLHCYECDRFGNARFAYTQQNFNTCMATAADIVILEAEKIVECGEIRPDYVQLPGVFVDYIVHCPVPRSL